MTAPPILVCDDLTVRFAGLTALNRVSFALAGGEMFGIIGPNGAGKSTLFNVITGIYKAAQGRVWFDGRDISGVRPDKIVRRGIARTFQSSRLFDDLSVLDNVIIGTHTRTRTGVLGALFRPGAARRELEAASQRAARLVRLVSAELYDGRDRFAGQLAQADRRRLEIARALASEPKLLLLDEPSSGMDDRETDLLVADLRRVRAERPDLSVIVIEHDMRVIAALPDRVIVLDYGNKIAEGPFSTVRQDARVQEAYLGKARQHA